MKNLYMHTLNGKPAMYQDGTYICYIDSTYRCFKYSDVFVDSLEAIKRQQLWSQQYHEQHGDADNHREYGYIRIQDDSGSNNG